MQFLSGQISVGRSQNYRRESGRWLLAARPALAYALLTLTLGLGGGLAHAGTCAASASFVSVVPSPSNVGESTIVTVQVMDSGPGMNTPGGQVRVSLSPNERCLLNLMPTVPATSEGACKIRPLTAGVSRTVTADYLGDGNCLATSVNQGLMVNQATSALQIVLDAPDPSQLNGSFVVSARLQPEFAAPTGSIVFDHSGDMCTATLPDQSCVFTSTIPGLINIGANYSGDVNFSGSSSLTVTHNVVTDTTFDVLSGAAPGVGTGYGSFNEFLGSEYRISDDGRFALIESLASNLAPGDTNGVLDVYVLELRTGQFERVSVADDEQEGDGDSYVGDISADGRFVLFASDASNLIGIGVDTNGLTDAFVRDRVAGTTVRVSLADGAVELPSGIILSNRRSLNISGDGLQATFSTIDPVNASDTNGVGDCYMRPTSGVAPAFPISTSSAGGYGDNFCEEVALNFDGSRAAFVSTATNLGQGSDVNGLFGQDVFLKVTDGGLPGMTMLLSESIVVPGNTGDFASRNVDIDAAGDQVVFATDATDLFSPDGNARRDVVLYSVASGMISPLSIFGGATQGNDNSDKPRIAAHGLFVAFVSDATNLVMPDTNASADILVIDLDTGSVRRDSVNSAGTEGNDTSFDPMISDDGRVTVFQSSATNFDPNAFTPASVNLFQRRVIDARTGWISRTVSGDLGNGDSVGVATSADGVNVVFDSEASNLVAGDSNAAIDVFHVVRPGAPTRVSLTNVGGEANGDSFDPAISDDGAYIAFTSEATNLVPVGVDINGASDVFLLQVAGAPGSIIRMSNAFGTSDAGDAESNEPVVSGNGNFIAFTSSATNLVSPALAPPRQRVFVYDRVGGSIEHVSVNTAGVDADSFAVDPSISDDGCKITFESDASNLDPLAPGGSSYVFVRDRCMMTTEVVSVDNTMPTPVVSNGNSFRGRISGDGMSVVFLSDGNNLDISDLNGVTDAFVRTLGGSPTTTRVSLANSGAELMFETLLADISTDGGRVLFANPESGAAMMRPDGRAVRGVVAIAQPSNVFMRQLTPAGTALVSQNMGGVPGDGFQLEVALSGDGSTAVFSSSATNLLPGDGNGLVDIYVSPLAPAGPSTCTWNGNASTWNNPAEWSGCAAGSGSTPGTPGFADTAIINSGTVDLSGDEVVDILQMAGGMLVGDGNLDITSAFDWSAGTIAATAATPSITLSSVAVSSWTGGDKFLTDRTLVNDGTINWSSGLIHLQDAVIDNTATGIWNWTFNGPVEYVDRSGGVAALLNNDGTIQKTGTAEGQIRNGVDFSGSGNIQIVSGDMLIAGNGGFSGNLDVSSGFALTLAEGAQVFDGTSSFTGAGDLHFGMPAGTPGIHAIDGTFSLTGTVRIEAAQVLFNNGTPLISTLALLDPGAVFGGMATPTVTMGLNWNAGVIAGLPGEQLNLDMGATSIIAGTPGDNFARFLDGRQINNDGVLRQVQGNGTRVINGGQLINNPGGVVDFLLPGGAAALFVADDADPGNLFDNQGTLSVNGGLQTSIDLPFDNSGTVDINSGSLIIFRSGTESGDYQVDNPGDLLLIGHNRTFPPGSDLTGTSSLFVDTAAVIDLQGAFGLTRLDLVGGSTLSWSQAAPLNMNTLVIDEGSTLNTQGPVNVAGGFFARDASVNGLSGVQILTLAMGGTAFLPNAASDILTFNDIDLRIDGTGQWSAGTINLDAGSSLTVDGVAQLNLNASTGSPVTLGCGSCLSPTVTNLGTLRQSGVGAGNDAFINGPIAFSNQGTVDVQSQSLSINNYTQSGAAATTQVAAGAMLQSAFQIQLSGGVLTGSGTVDADVNDTGAIIRPGTSPGILTITGNLDMVAGSVLEMEVGGLTPGTQHDQLVVGGTANLDGTLDVIQFMAFTPGPVDFFNLVQFAASTGTVTLGANPFPSHELAQTPTSVVLQPIGGPLVVTTTLDPGDGTCDLAGTGDGCTLREAINAANGVAGPDLIVFNIPGPGPHTIAPLTSLPPITDEVIIDGYTQTGAVPGSMSALDGGIDSVLAIELSGASAPGDGLFFSLPAGSTGAVIGLAINRFSGAGVRIDSASSGNVGIYGNFIGSSVDGLSAPTPMQGDGIVINNAPGGASVNLGSALSAERNLISGNLNHGVVIDADNVIVEGNLIGTDATGLAPLPNGRRGIFFNSNTQAINGVVGGLLGEQRNVISANVEDGIGLQCAPVITDLCFDGTTIVNNYIGVGVDGTIPLGNANGVNVIEMTYGQVNLGGAALGAANKIEFNLGSGVLSAAFPVAGTETQEGRLCLARNIFANNAGLGIDFDADGRQINDPLDADGGFNNGQNYPLISNFLPDTPTTGQFTVEYSVDTDFANAAFPLVVEFFRADGDEGLEFLGAASYSPASPGGTESFVLPGTPAFGIDDILIATATDGDCKSSEFSYYDLSMEITDDSPDPSLIGDPYPVEVTMMPNGPFSVQGDVFVDDGNTEACMISLLPSDFDVGSCLLNSPLDIGSFTLGAFYDDTNQAFGPAVDPDGEPHDVGNPTAFSNFTITPEPSGAGDPYMVDVALTAIVGTPSGTVDVLGTGGETCTINLVGGAGQCTTNAVNVGAQGVTVTYNPDPTFELVVSMLPHMVDQAATTTQITAATPDPSAVSTPVNVQVLVQPAVAGNILTPAGSVTVNANTGESCVVAAIDGSGMGACDITLNTVGPVNLTATYAGNTEFLGSASAVEPHTVVLGPPEDTTTTIVAATPEPSVVGQPYQVDVQVAGDLGGTPCGTVTITQLPNSDSCMATLAAGVTPGTAVGSCSLTAPNAITKALIADYVPGACNFAGSQSPLATHGVIRAQTSTAIVAQNPNPSGVGQTVTVQFAVTVQAPGAGTPTGIVTVTDGIDVCQATLPVNSCQISFKTAGNRSLSVSYAGDADFNASSATGTQQVLSGGADLSIRKRNDRCVLPGGNRVAYRIEVSNLGPEAVTNARVTDSIPAGLSNASWTCTASGGASCTASGSGGIDTLVNLPTGGGLVFSFSADVQRAPEITVNNTASVATPAGVSDPVPGNNSSTDSDPIGIYCDGLEDPFSD